jgi:hypothetical protein
MTRTFTPTKTPVASAALAGVATIQHHSATVVALLFAINVKSAFGFLDLQM